MDLECGKGLVFIFIPKTDRALSRTISSLGTLFLLKKRNKVVAYTFICSFHLSSLRDRGTSKERCYAGSFLSSKQRLVKNVKLKGAETVKL